MAGEDAAWAFRRGASTSCGDGEVSDVSRPSVVAGCVAPLEVAADEGFEDDRDEQRMSLELSEDAVEAHSQVLEMAATIEILTRDFENLQRELIDAYKKLQDYSSHDPRHGGGIGTNASGGIVANAIAKLRSGSASESCGHEAELAELKRVSQ
ncbi:hypothetical protein ATCC90586_006831 [Pythium insidiosum]|nr:hypothetical protein ATCC90586_006831 [Pythium insidiosum]